MVSLEAGGGTGFTVGGTGVGGIGSTTGGTGGVGGGLLPRFNKVGLIPERRGAVLP